MSENGSIRHHFGPDGSVLITFEDGHTVNLNRAIRLRKTAVSAQVREGFTCEGVLADAPTAVVKGDGIMRVRLRFYGGAEVDWCPALGDRIENVEDEP